MRRRDQTCRLLLRGGGAGSPWGSFPGGPGDDPAPGLDGPAPRLGDGPAPGLGDDPAPGSGGDTESNPND